MPYVKGDNISFYGLKLPSLLAMRVNNKKANMKWARPKFVVSVHAASGTAYSLAKEYGGWGHFIYV